MPSSKPSAARDRARRRGSPNPKPSDAEIAERELQQSARTLVRHLAREPDSVRALLLGDLLAAVMAEAAPPALRAIVVPELSPEARSREGLGHIASSLWMRLVQLEQLTPARAAAIALRLAPVMTSVAQLFIYEEQARERGLADAAATFAAALDARFPTFRGERHRMPIDRALLEGAGFDLERLRARFHDNGHLAEVRSPGEGPRLELEREPGAGRYVQTGKRGGYGFHVDERYSDGHARGTFNSPWHDGEEYATKKEWLAWVLENVSEVDRARPR